MVFNDFHYVLYFLYFTLFFIASRVGPWSLSGRRATATAGTHGGGLMSFVKSRKQAVQHCQSQLSYPVTSAAAPL